MLGAGRPFGRDWHLTSDISLTQDALTLIFLYLYTIGPKGALTAARCAEVDCQMGNTHAVGRGSGKCSRGLTSYHSELVGDHNHEPESSVLAWHRRIVSLSAVSRALFGMTADKFTTGFCYNSKSLSAVSPEGWGYYALERCTRSTVWKYRNRYNNKH